MAIDTTYFSVDYIWSLIPLFLGDLRWLYDKLSIHRLGAIRETSGNTSDRNWPPFSQYADNIRFVDAGLKQLVREIDDYFNDSRTLFVFSSDHGMTDWGEC